jgi:pyruvate dehydrogenase E2 component (dihydrolipoamide acetyltransferase)
MAIPVIMPKQGQSVETCIITSWLKHKGDPVHTGDILFSYETDKAAFDVESPSDGILLEVFFDEGAEVPVLVNVAVIGSKGESTESFTPGKSSGQIPAEASTAPPADLSVVSTVSESLGNPETTDTKTRISPRAKHLALDKGIDIHGIYGSGPNGRIIVRDIENTLSKAASGTVQKSTVPGADYSEKPLSNVRKMIAKAMYSSLQSSAQLTHHMGADVRKLLETRRLIKNNLSTGKGKQDITLNDMICWCVIRALEKFPEANSHFLDDRIKTFHKVHLGLAVDTPRGLMVPTVRNASDMDLVKLSKELKSVAEACKKGNINPELIQGSSASFTVSNLGNYGVEMFTPVINLPQVGILGVCTIVYRPADLGAGIIGIVPYIGLSLTYDHRAIDGGPATFFLKEIKDQIEAFRYEL